MSIVRETVDLGGLLADCEVMTRGQRSAAELRFTLSLGEERLLISGEAAKLRQIFLNLFSNAIKFTPKGGAVSVRVDLSEADRIIVEIRDTGIGMAPEEI